MKRGEVWWINFDPAVGGEIRKNRPAVIVSCCRLGWARRNPTATIRGI